MYYQEKKTITSIICGVLVLATYTIYGLAKYQASGLELLNDLRFWATTMLVFIGGGIVLIILTQIVFHILLAVTNEVKKEIVKQIANEAKCKEFADSCQNLEISEAEDEMDKLIALKAMRNSYLVVGVGFILSLVALAMQSPPAIMLNIIFLSFQLGSLFEGFSQLYFYRRGI